MFSFWVSCFLVYPYAMVPIAVNANIANPNRNSSSCSIFIYVLCGRLGLFDLGLLRCFLNFARGDFLHPFFVF